MRVVAALSESTWREYAGEWVAVREGEIVAHADSLEGVCALLRATSLGDPEDCDYVIQVPHEASVPFERWRERALVAGREFRRRLRG